MGSGGQREGVARGERGARPQDRRVRRSRRAMMDAFDRLIMATPFERITVSAVAREADVDRKTFYQHFGTVDGLLDAIVEDVVSELLDEVERASAGGGEELAAFFDALARHLSRDLVLRQRYCEHIPVDLLFEHLARPLASQVMERGLVRGDVSDAELEMLLSFGLGGLFSTYRWWLLSDRELTLDELTRRAVTLLEGGAEALLGSRPASAPLAPDGDRAMDDPPCREPAEKGGEPVDHEVGHPGDLV